MSSKLEKLGTVAVIVAALSVTATAVRRELRPSVSPSSDRSTSREPTYLKGWRDLRERGILLGDSSARVTIVEFADFECPFCAHFDPALSALRQKMGRDLAVVFIHLPLPNHRFARPAARAAECAAVQQKFDELREVLFRKQDSLGLKSWASFGTDAGVSDLPRFVRCANDTTAVPRIEAGIELARKLHLPGTPTVFINGWQYWGLTPEGLEEEVHKREGAARG